MDAPNPAFLAVFHWRATFGYSLDTLLERRLVTGFAAAFVGFFGAGFFFGWDTIVVVVDVLGGDFFVPDFFTAPVLDFRGDADFETLLD